MKDRERGNERQRERVNEKEIKIDRLTEKEKNINMEATNSGNTTRGRSRF